MKKFLSVVLTFIILTSVMFGIKASAIDINIAETGYSIPNEVEFIAKLNQLRTKYPNGGTWSGTYYENGTAKAWQCFGYANQMLYEVFGVQFYNDGFYNKKDYNMGTIYAGDWVRIKTYGEPNNHSVFITKVTNDRVYFTDANWSGNNGIRWDVSYTKAEFAQKFSYKVHISGNTLTGNGVTGNNPQGCFDGVSSPSPGKLTVSGWAFDRDNLGASLGIHIYVGGPSGSGAPGYAITADKSRPDVNNAYPGVGNNHGFADTISVSKTGTQTIYVYAINVGGGNTNPLLGSKTVNIQRDTVKPTISSITVSQVTSKGYRVSCEVSDNVDIATVKFPTWTLYGDQDDLIWHVGQIEGNVATYYVKTGDHKNETGSYITHIYAYDSAGNSCSSSTEIITVTDEPKEISSVVYNGNTYKVFNSGKNWEEAEKWCEQQGGHLATISNSSEWNVVKQALEKFNGIRCWLGANCKSGSWKWVDGTSMQYSNWDTNQPDNCGGSEKYLGTWGSEYMNCYKWNDFNNDAVDIGGFVCEFENYKTPTEPTTTIKPIHTTVKTKNTNPITVTTKTKTVKFKNLKAKNQTIKAISVKKAEGKVTYKLKSVSSKIKKLTKVNSKGIITIKRWNKVKRGTYNIKVTIKATGNSNYKAKSVTKTVKVKIK